MILKRNGTQVTINKLSDRLILTIFTDATDSDKCKFIHAELSTAEVKELMKELWEKM